MRHGKKFHPAKILFGIMGVIVMVALVGYVVMLLWNFSMAEVAGVSSITFWQAVALLVLSRILFGGWRGFGKHHRGSGPPWKSRRGSFTEEEKESFKARWKARCEKMTD